MLLDDLVDIFADTHHGGDGIQLAEAGNGEDDIVVEGRHRVD